MASEYPGFETSATITRRTLMNGVAVAPMLAIAGTGHAAEIQKLPVPIDHRRPDEGRFDLTLLQLSPFNPERQTVLVVADGQQFYVSPGTFDRAVGPLFTDRFNVIGVHGRATAEPVIARVGMGDRADWREAWRLLQSSQWVADLEAARSALLGANGRVSLYGRSGGGLLAHQYAARHGDRVAAVYTQAAVCPNLEQRFGLSSDRFWKELDAGDKAALVGVLKSGNWRRDEIAALFQRQHFFVRRADLSYERTVLIEALARGDVSAVNARREAYQVDAVDQLMKGALGPSVRVRLFELRGQSSRCVTSDRALHPDTEVLEAGAEPLTALAGAGAIDVPTIDMTALHGCLAPAWIVAGRWDHTCDYRTQIALSCLYPQGRLLLLDDDHVMSALKESGKDRTLVNMALDATKQASREAVVDGLEQLIWRETARCKSPV